MFMRELSLRQIEFQRQVALPILQGYFAGLRLSFGLLVSDQVVVELKSIEKIEPIHEAQLLSYLKLSRY